MSPEAIWALVQIDEYGPARARALAEQNGADPIRIEEVVGELRALGLLVGEDGAAELTAHGREHADRVVRARRDLLAERLADGSPDRHPEVEALLVRLARELCGEPPAATVSAA
jgi:Mn-dependent DtxR family transcriptional regulator